MKFKVMSIVLVSLLAAASFTGCRKAHPLNRPGDLVPKTVTEDLLLPAITVNGTKLHAETFGNAENPMVVVLHGGPGADYRSMLNCKALANDGYFVVFYDQRGSGLSQRHEKSIYSLQIMLDDLSGVINYYRKSANQKVFLFGHSWGAMLATAYVNAHPTAISGAILAEPGGFTWEQTRDYIGRTRPANATGETDDDALFFDKVLTGNETQDEILDYKFAKFAANDTKEGNIIGNAGPYPFWRMGAVVNSTLIDIASRDGFNWTTNLGQFKTKVLFCYSELNKAYGLEHAKLVSSAYPNVQLERINGSGHEMIYFGWNNFYPLVKTYLNSVK